MEDCYGRSISNASGSVTGLIISPPTFLSCLQKNARIGGSEKDESNLVVTHLFSNKTTVLI